MRVTTFELSICKCILHSMYLTAFRNGRLSTRFAIKYRLWDARTYDNLHLFYFIFRWAQLHNDYPFITHAFNVNITIHFANNSQVLSPSMYVLLFFFLCFRALGVFFILTEPNRIKPVQPNTTHILTQCTFKDSMRLKLYFGITSKRHFSSEQQQLIIKFSFNWMRRHPSLTNSTLTIMFGFFFLCAVHTHLLRRSNLFGN